jgi:hypothetical protein
MINITEKVTGMTFQGTEKEVEMWINVMKQVHMGKNLQFEEVLQMRVVVDKIENLFINTVCSGISVLEDSTDNTTGKIHIQIDGLGYTLRVRRDESYDMDRDIDSELNGLDYDDAKEIHEVNSNKIEVEMNGWGGVDCRKTCTEEERKACIHFDCMRAHPKDVGGAGECFKLKGKTIPNLVWDSETTSYVTDTSKVTQ